MSARRYTIAIERLLLRGPETAPGQAARLRELIEVELAHQVAEAPPAAPPGEDTAHLRAPAVRAGFGEAHMAGEIARSVARALQTRRGAPP